MAPWKCPSVSEASAPSGEARRVERSRPERAVRHVLEENRERPHLDAIIRAELTVAQIDEHPSPELRQLGYRTQAGQLRRREPRLGLDFERQGLAPAA